MSFYSLSHSCDRAGDDFLLEVLLEVLYVAISTGFLCSRNQGSEHAAIAKQQNNYQQQWKTVIGMPLGVSCIACSLKLNL